MQHRKIKEGNKSDAEDSLRLEKDGLLEEYLDDEVKTVKTDLPNKFEIGDDMAGTFIEVHIEEKPIQ